MNSETLSEDFYWRIIPPEEKLEMLSESQGLGLSSSAMFLFFFIVTSIGYYFPWLILAGFGLCPLIYQIASNRIWNQLKAEKLIYYLAARSACRRFAYSLGSNDLEPRILFRGELEECYDSEYGTQTISKMPVWVSLFTDCIVVIQEREGGAILRFGSIFGLRLNVSVENGTVMLRKVGFAQDKFLYKISSRYAVALKAFADLLESLQKSACDKFKVFEEFLA